MSNMALLQERKAQRVATVIFEFHMNSKLFDRLDATEKLGVLSDKIYVLKTRFKEKPFAQLIAKYLLWTIDDYTRENLLCPECYHKTRYTPLLRKNYWQSEAGKLVCDHCGWSEDIG